MNEYKVSGFVRVYYTTVVSADSAEEARELVEETFSPSELVEGVSDDKMEIQVHDCGPL